jgi:DNA-3-methyladenine glycosylase I
MMMPSRCEWVGDDPLMLAYHDSEWGVPLHDDAGLFELLTLEGAQAGLSWMTILKKREGYRRAFELFVPERVASFGKRKIASLLKDPSIVRNRLKVESTVANAKAVLDIQKEFGSFDVYIWRFVNGTPIQNNWKQLTNIPAESEVSRAMSRELKQRGFRFVGPTICYAFMQAVGMVNDHTEKCFRHLELQSTNRQV